MATGQYGFLDNKNLIGIWDQMYEPALNGVWATQIGTMVDSTMETESYGWLGAAPGPAGLGRATAVRCDRLYHAI
ncbi:MAG TPA: hypothetical protein VHQ47_08860 [Phycisphaerae bacterium]|nr:hypothetical protein [Phycisphaerae bacterium]HVV70154.1 hypothetical protein [Verrucomicrobiae bacterium]